MKKITLLFLLITGTTITSFAQEEVLDVVEQPAQFPGGQTALTKYLSNHINYPNEALKLGITGKCYAKFVISTSGKVSNVTIIKGVPNCPECDAEVVRVLRSMPNWEPAMNNGKVVNSYYNIPVTFMTSKTKKQLRKEARARRKNGDF